MNTTDLRSVAEEQEEEDIAADIIQPKEGTTVPECETAVDSADGEVSDESAEANRELGEVFTGEEGEEYRSAAVGLVNGILAQLDQEEWVTGTFPFEYMLAAVDYILCNHRGEGGERHQLSNILHCTSCLAAVQL